MAPEEETGGEERWTSDAELADDVLRMLVSELRAQHLGEHHEASA